MDDQGRQRIAQEVFDTLLSPRIQKPLKVEDLDVRTPRFVAAFAPIADSKSFWRVPIFSLSYGRLVGFFDVRDFDHRIELLRASPLPRRNVRKLEEIVSLPPDVVEMTEQTVEAQIARSFSVAVTVLGEPQLIFYQVETKVAWKVNGMRATNLVTIIVTPGFAFDSV